ncbi:DUF4190 domain-containing protein [Streptomyces triticisoli]|uniref:DUF4190 domain-containing protein n=1 Tax=Streptomyces triticisoli TaxID=2182797 RepID=UPI000DDB0533|nr:DUF4190 domain-containing protein [Streptomyces triticisoli]
MTDGIQADGGAGAENDPWAPPADRPSLEKNPPAPQQPSDPYSAQDQPLAFPPPSVHDQATVVSMPGADFPPPGYGAPAAVPPPPIAPTGPGAPAGPVPGGYGYPAYPGYPGGQGYGWPGTPMTPPQNGMGTAAMVLGILSCTMFCVYGVFSVVLGVIAVVLGIKGRRRSERGEATNHGQAQAGLVTGIIGLVLGLAVMVVMIIAIVVGINAEDSTDPYYDARAPLPTATAPIAP